MVLLKWLSVDISMSKGVRDIATIEDITVCSVRGGGDGGIGGIALGIIGELPGGIWYACR